MSQQPSIEEANPKIKAWIAKTKMVRWQRWFEIDKK